jgi:hypothetical protein
VLGFNACGHKGAPFYSKEAPIGDENIEFIIKSEENNASCE